MGVSASGKVRLSAYPQRGPEGEIGRWALYGTVTGDGSGGQAVISTTLPLLNRYGYDLRWLSLVDTQAANPYIRLQLATGEDRGDGSSGTLLFWTELLNDPGPGNSALRGDQDVLRFFRAVHWPEVGNPALSVYRANVLAVVTEIIAGGYLHDLQFLRTGIPRT